MTSDKMENGSAKLIAQAKDGDEQALGKLLGANRQYLRVLARIEIGRRLQRKVDESDIVQQTFLEAYKSFENFNGSTEPQFNSWIRSILVHTLANTVRHYFGTQARDPRLEQQIGADLDYSTESLAGIVTDSGDSPSVNAVKAEQARIVIDAMSSLPLQYNTVLTLRHIDGLTFPKIAERLNKSVDSVEKLWIRGIAKLRKKVTLSVTKSEIR